MRQMCDEVNNQGYAPRVSVMELVDAAQTIVLILFLD